MKSLPQVNYNLLKYICRWVSIVFHPMYKKSDVKQIENSPVHYLPQSQWRFWWQILIHITTLEFQKGINSTQWKPIEAKKKQIKVFNVTLLFVGCHPSLPATQQSNFIWNSDVNTVFLAKIPTVDSHSCASCKNGKLIYTLLELAVLARATCTQLQATRFQCMFWLKTWC